MGPPSIKVPEPTEEERALQRAQADVLNQQRDIIARQVEQQNILLPFFADQAGIDIQFDSEGNISGATKRTDPLDEQGREIQGLLNERSLAALRGDLPVDPVLERELASKEQELRDRLFSQFGPGFETSTPGIQTLDEFFRSAEGLRSSARTGQLSLAEQLGLARTGSNEATQAQGINIFRGSAVGDPLSYAGGFGANAQGFGQAQIPFIQHRQMQLQANVQNAQNQMSFLGGIGSLAGTLFGSIFPGF